MSKNIIRLKYVRTWFIYNYTLQHPSVRPEFLHFLFFVQINEVGIPQWFISNRYIDTRYSYIHRHPLASCTRLPHTLKWIETYSYMLYSWTVLYWMFIMYLCIDSLWCCTTDRTHPAPPRSADTCRVTWVGHLSSSSCQVIRNTCAHISTVQPPLEAWINRSLL